jgi:hypothetical protein
VRARWSSRVGGGICSGRRTWRAPLRRPVRSPAVPSGGGGYVLGDARARARRRHVVLRAGAVTNADQRVQPRRAAADPAAHPGHGLAHLGDLSWHRGRPGRRRGGHRRRRRPLRGYAGGAAALPSLRHVYNKRPLKHRGCDQKGPAPCQHSNDPAADGQHRGVRSRCAAGPACARKVRQALRSVSDHLRANVGSDDGKAVIADLGNFATGGVALLITEP